MTERKPFPLLTLMAIFAGVVVLLGAYVAGYLWLGQKVDAQLSHEQIVWRVYSQPWQLTLFAPAATVEGTLTGKRVFLSMVDADGYGWVTYPPLSENDYVRQGGANAPR